jgi:predicted transposase YbfD/YdcC
LLHPKKVGELPVDGSADEVKQTNEIGMAIPLLEGVVDIEGKVVTSDAINTQRKLATYLVEQRQAHYHFTVKGNQPTLLADIERHFQDRGEPDYVEPTSLAHGRITQRSIWVTTALNGYLTFPHVGQAFLVIRKTVDKKTGKRSDPELAYGVTSCTVEQADAKRVLGHNRGHWSIEAQHNITDWNFDEDRSRIRKGHGPANIARLRRFAIGLIKAKGKACVAQTMRQLCMNTRSLLDYLAMTENAAIRCAA